ncbi:hypothetical protein CJ739_1354 [Mariniflexile rhizosphaerae]|uniref:hypothetical protein n=1 Tax=unclassified Mariniflexile TaxID=2643887 RepID=UPI000CB9F861|nr:hypothetical protein [Mariniflexile sp. TRM1-10]AXP80443.1 hypothetical protein CJ739_1354 [Mariniflexile sp. TRM1-10]PLB20535.1 MAG: hypothetical protein TRG1_517 [Flavobacteriaceae bacterium FS1-H7996/R]
MITHRNILGAIMLFLCLSQNIWSQENTNDLIGTWAFDYEASLAAMDSNGRSQLKDMERSPMRLQRFESVYKGRRISFFGDGRFVLSLADGRGTDAKWELRNDQQIALVDSRGIEKNYKIILLTSDRLVIGVQKVFEKTKPLFTKYYYSKTE